MLATSVSGWASVQLCGSIHISDLKIPCIIWGDASLLTAISVAGIAFICWLIRRPPKKITAASLAKRLNDAALMSLVVVLVVILMPMVAPASLALLHMAASEDSIQPGSSASYENGVASPENGVDGGHLLTAAATIMGLAVFGSALGTLRLNRELIRGIAYTLLPIIVVQAAFMLGIVGTIHFPVVVWIPMTAILLMLAVLAMVANRLLPDKADGNATASGA